MGDAAADGADATSEQVRDMGIPPTPLEEEMVEIVLQELDTYVSRIQNTIAQIIVTRSIMGLCLKAV